MDQEFEIKPISVKSLEQFEKMSEELLSQWTEYKKLDAKMKLLDSSVKNYMIKNGMNTYKNNHGNLSIITQTRNILDRNLIDNIEQYKVESEINIMFKSAKKLQL